MKKKKASPQSPSNAGSRPSPSIHPAKPARTAPRPSAAKRYAVIDYPLAGEIVTSPHYAFRIGAGGADRVEVSIDGKEWQPCRPAAGYWWFDWSGYNAGPHQIRARIPSGKRFLVSKPRQFTALV